MNKTCLFIGPAAAPSDDYTAAFKALDISIQAESENINLAEGSTADYLFLDLSLNQEKLTAIIASVRKSNPDIFIAGVTKENTEASIDFCLQHDLGTVLYSPVPAKKAAKLLSGIKNSTKLFGLENAVKDVTPHYNQRIKNLSDVMQARESIVKLLDQGDIKPDNKTSVNFKFVYWEMALNAVYHAFGHTDSKMKREDIELGENDLVDISYGDSPTEIAVAITDNKGALTSEVILCAIEKSLDVERKTDKNNPCACLDDIQLHSGRGMNMARRLSKQFRVITKPGEKTEIIITFDKKLADPKAKKAAEIIFIDI